MNTTLTSNISNRTALLIGASGLVGSFCLKLLLERPEYDKVIALVRRPLDITHPKLEQSVMNFDKLAKFKTEKYLSEQSQTEEYKFEEYQSIIRGNDIYCCIGTTFLKSPKKADYYKVDFTYPYQIAKIAKANGAEQFSLISALSASLKSPFFYSRVKAELEKAIMDLNFRSVYIFRPSFLIGQRKESRPIEKIGVIFLKVLSPVLIGRLRKFRPIKAEKVADAMVQISIKHEIGCHIYESHEIENL